VAVLAHAVAHGVNGDVTRSFLVGSALRSLDEWIYLLQGVGHHARSGPEALAGYLTWILSLPFALYQSLLTQLLWLDKQQAEYFADYLASTVSGTDASIGALRRLSSSEHLHDVLLKSAFSNSQSGSYILQRYSEHIYTLPGREWQRLARAAEQEHARLDASHPPTAHRIEFLRAHPRIEQMTVSDKRMKTIDSELQSLHDKLGGRLIAQYARD
jgi:heat shock protein HtpX